MPGSGDRVTFCVRPEALGVDAKTNRFAVAVETAEFLGETGRYYAEWEGQTIVFRTPGPDFAGELTLGFNPADASVI